MKKQIVALILSLVFIFALASTAAAVSETKITAELIYRDIKIMLNGEEIQPKDATGKDVEPFIIDGTTYLPVRAVSNALGLEVGWDDATSTVSLTEPEPENPDVYITRTGSKYHHNDTCNGGTYWPVPFETATGMGLTPCDKCVH